MYDQMVMLLKPIKELLNGCTQLKNDALKILDSDFNLPQEELSVITQRMDELYAQVKQLHHQLGYREKSKIGALFVKAVSWLSSPIVASFNAAHRLYLRFADRVKYDAIIAQEKQRFAYLINDQADTNFFHLYEIIAMYYDNPHMKKYLKRGVMYRLTAHQALEGGALLAKDIELDSAVTMWLEGIAIRLLAPNFYKLYDNQLLQGIYEMNCVLKEAKQLMKDRGGIDKFAMYDADAIEVIILKEAANRKLKLTNEKSYTDYLKSWIRNTSNTKKAAVALGAIGALYVFGYFLPENLKYYAQLPLNTIGSGIKKAVNYVADKTGLTKLLFEKRKFEEDIALIRGAIASDMRDLLDRDDFQSIILKKPSILEHLQKNPIDKEAVTYFASVHYAKYLADKIKELESLLKRKILNSQAVDMLEVYYDDMSKLETIFSIFEAKPNFEVIRKTYELHEQVIIDRARKVGIDYKGY